MNKHILSIVYSLSLFQFDSLAPFSTIHNKNIEKLSEKKLNEPCTPISIFAPIKPHKDKYIVFDLFKLVVLALPIILIKNIEQLNKNNKKKQTRNSFRSIQQVFGLEVRIMKRQSKKLPSVAENSLNILKDVDEDKCNFLFIFFAQF